MTDELLTLGTAAGPAIRGSEPGICSAVRVNDDFYLIDFGLGCTRAAVPRVMSSTVMSVSPSYVLAS